MNVTRPMKNCAFILSISNSKCIWAPKFQSFSLHFTNSFSIWFFVLPRPFGFHLTNEKVSPMTDLPPAGTVFAIDLDDDGFHRVVCNDDVSAAWMILPFDFDCWSVKKIFISFKANKLFLIDCGEVIDVDDTQLKLFSLSNKAQKTSAKAIPCTVVQVTLVCMNHLAETQIT